MGERRFLGSGVHRDVTLGGGDSLWRFTCAIVGISRHDDGAPGFLRIGMLAIDGFELLRSVFEIALGHHRIGVSKHLARADPD